VEENGLKNLPTSADALPALCDPEVVQLFTDTGVLSPVELQSRFEVYSEQYILSIEVEAKLVVDMVRTLFYPAAMKYLASLTTTNLGVSQLGIALDDDTMQSVSTGVNAMMKAVTALSTAMARHEFSSVNEHMHHCAYEIRPLMDAVRVEVDQLETVVADELWPLPKYRELLFIR